MFITNHPTMQQFSFFHRLTPILFLSFFCFSTQSKAEEIKKVKYGNVTLDELKMVTYAKDTSADAVVLYSYGEFSPILLNFTQHIKIKILRLSGREQANMVFYGKLSNKVRGCTYNLENGNIVRTPLQKESIFEVRQLGNYYNTRIALPNVRVGSVIEVEIIQDDIPYSYDFQQSIPVIYSALYFPQSSDINVVCNATNNDYFTYKDATTWIVKDIPAFKNQPYVKTANSFPIKIVFELSTIDNRINFKPFGEARNAKTTWYGDRNRFEGGFKTTAY